MPDNEAAVAIRARTIAAPLRGEADRDEAARSLLDPTLFVTE